MFKFYILFIYLNSTLFYFLFIIEILNYFNYIKYAQN